MDTPSNISSPLLKTTGLGSSDNRALINNLVMFLIKTNIENINIKKYIDSVLCIFICFVFFEYFGSQLLE